MIHHGGGSLWSCLKRNGIDSDTLFLPDRRTTDSKACRNLQAQGLLSFVSVRPGKNKSYFHLSPTYLLVELLWSLLAGLKCAGPARKPDVVRISRAQQGALARGGVDFVGSGEHVKVLYRMATTVMSEFSGFGTCLSPGTHLLKKLDSGLTLEGRVIWVPCYKDTDPATLESLKRLGYVSEFGMKIAPLFLSRSVPIQLGPAMTAVVRSLLEEASSTSVPGLSVPGRNQPWSF